MIFEVHIPGRPLSQFVETIIYFEGFRVDYEIERFLPDGNVELIIDLLDVPEHVYDNRTFKPIQKCTKGWASGLRTAPICIPAGDGASKLVVVFRKGMAYPFFPVPMHSFSDTVVDADYFWKGEFDDLRDRLLSAETPAERFALTERFLAAKLDSGTELNPCVEYAVRVMREHPDDVSMAELTTKIGYSQKHLIDMFKRHVGVTPKRYLKLMRFQKAIGAIERAKQVNWPMIALDSGFYDQAHFVNDFKRFSGFTPREYLEQRSDTLNYVPVK